MKKSVKIIRTTTVPRSFKELLRGQLQFLSQYYDVVAVSGNSDSLLEVSDREGVRVVSIEMRRRISIFRDLVSLINMIRLFKKEKPTIVHSITPKAGLLTMLAGKISGVPIRMHTFTGLIFPTRTGLMQKLLIKMDQLLCWAATAVYPEGEGVKNDLINFGVTNKALKVLANGNVNGIDTDYYCLKQVSRQQKQDLRAELKISDSDFVYIFVGRIVKDKGINELVEAFRMLVNEGNSNLKLILVGNEERELDPLKKETVIEIDTNPNIIAVGYQVDVRPYFAISHCLTFPSYREGFPNVVLQAGAMGLPSIVTNINGCNEIIKNNINGVIIPPYKVDVLKNEMKNMYQNQKMFNVFKSNSRVMVTERYEQLFVWKAILNEYQEALENISAN